MLLWHSPQIDDITKIFNAATQLNSKGNDCSYTNIILYKEKLHTQIAFYNDCLFRKIRDSQENDFYLFPLGKAENLPSAIQAIVQDAKTNNNALFFINFSMPYVRRFDYSYRRLLHLPVNSYLLKWRFYRIFF